MNITYTDLTVPFLMVWSTSMKGETQVALWVAVAIILTADEWLLCPMQILDKLVWLCFGRNMQ